MFEAAVPPFQEALSKSGYNRTLEFEPPEKRAPKKNNRKCPVTWFNPTFSLSVKTNVGKEFLDLLDRSFPPDNPLSKLFNRHTVKVSYKCMPNMATATSIARHNSKVLSEGTQTVKVGLQFAQYRVTVNNLVLFTENVSSKIIQE